MSWRFCACHGELTSEGLPPVAELLVDTFGVRCSMRTTLRLDYVSHLEGVTPFVWKSRQCEREMNLTEGRLNLAS